MDNDFLGIGKQEVQPQQGGGAVLAARWQKLKSNSAYLGARKVVDFMSGLGMVLGYLSVLAAFIILLASDMKMLGVVLLLGGSAMMIGMKLLVSLTTVQFDIADVYLLRLDELDRE